MNVPFSILSTSGRTQGATRQLSLLLMLCFPLGCGVAPEGNAAESANTNTEEPTAKVSEAVTYSTWKPSWSQDATDYVDPAFHGNLYPGIAVCRAWFMNQWNVGKIWGSPHQCLFEYGGYSYAAGPNAPARTAVVPTFQTLLNYGLTQYYMVNMNNWCYYGQCPKLFDDPSTLVDGGWPVPGDAVRTNHVQQGICFVQDGPYYHPGKWVDHGCNIEYGGSALRTTGVGYGPYVLIHN